MPAFPRHLLNVSKNQLKQIIQTTYVFLPRLLLLRQLKRNIFSGTWISEQYHILKDTCCKQLDRRICLPKRKLPELNEKGKKRNKKQESQKDSAWGSYGFPSCGYLPPILSICICYRTKQSV